MSHLACSGLQRSGRARPRLLRPSTLVVAACRNLRLKEMARPSKPRSLDQPIATRWPCRASPTTQARPGPRPSRCRRRGGTEAVLR